MGRSPCCEKVGLKKGPWTPEEDQKLLAYIEEHGHGSWRALPLKAGLLRCGKSCRLRWTNYLRPDIKRGKFSVQEEQTIIQLHALLGNRWSAIATHLPKRTDNEIKNYWNTHLKKRLAKMGIDPVTHKPKSDALSLVDGQNKNAATLSHMAQWESARLEAEARLVRESKLRSKPFDSITTPQLGLPALSSVATNMASQSAPLCLDVLKAWQGCWLRSAKGGGATGSQDLESPTSTLSFSENLLPTSTVGYVENQASTFELMENLAPAILCNDSDEEGWKGLAKCGVYSFTTQAIQRSHDNLDEKPTDITGKLSQLPEHSVGRDTRTATRLGYFDTDFPAWSTESSKTGSSSVSATATVDFNCTDASPMAKPGPNYMESFMNTDLLLVLADSNEPAAAPKTENSNDHSSTSGDSEADAGEDEENKSYWNTILHLVNSSPTSSSMF